jgi:DNA-binding CsgD family transcriptional regulator
VRPEKLISIFLRKSPFSGKEDRRMGRSQRLRIDDVEDVYTLVEECRELWADAAAWQEHLVRGACRLTRMAVGQYNEQRLAPDLTSTDILDETFGGEWRDASARECAMRMYRDHANRAAFFPRCMRLASQALRGSDATAVRRHLRPDEEWYRSFVYNEYRRPAYMDDLILSFAFNPNSGSVIMLAVNQDVSDRAPTARAASILSLLTHRVAPLVGTALATKAQHGAHQLSPRLRQILERILAGDAQKEAARQLGLHPTTVHHYVGELYRRFNVESRSQLMAYFVSRRPGSSHAPR